VRRKLQPEPEEPEVVHRRIEVKIGGRSVIVEQSELDNLIEALTEMRRLATGSKALMNIGTS